MMLALAESCTGGMIGSLITDTSGSSSVFVGSAVTYSNEAKEYILGVNHDTLIKYGAVSKEAAVEMAEGARNIYHSDIAASVTGIAGPTGGTTEKPVGTVFMAVTDGKRTVDLCNHFKGTRSEIRQQSADTLIDLVNEFIRGIK